MEFKIGFAAKNAEKKAEAVCTVPQNTGAPKKVDGKETGVFTL